MYLFHLNILRTQSQVFANRIKSLYVHVSMYLFVSYEYAHMYGPTDGGMYALVIKCVSVLLCISVSVYV